MKLKFKMLLNDYLADCPASQQNLLTSNFDFLSVIIVLKDAVLETYDCYVRDMEKPLEVCFERYLADIKLDETDLTEHPELLRAENYGFTIANPITGEFDPSAPMRFWLLTPRQKEVTFYLFKPTESNQYSSILELLMGKPNPVTGIV